MNFKIFLLISFIVSSCGLKTKPKSPQGTGLESIPDSYSTNIEVENKEEKKDNSQKKN